MCVCVCVCVYLDVGFVDEDGRLKLGPLADDLAENDGLLEEEDLQLFVLFRLLFAQVGAAVQLGVQQQLALRRDFSLKRKKTTKTKQKQEY